MNSNDKKMKSNDAKKEDSQNESELNTENPLQNKKSEPTKEKTVLSNEAFFEDDPVVSFPDTQSLQDQVNKSQSELLYMRAEFDNYKKQAIKERSLLIKYGAERFMTELLEVVDIFNTAMSIDMTPENLGSFHDGVKMTAHELENVMERFGLVKINSLGEVFNPAHHEAVGSEESKDVPTGNICRVYKEAYNLHGKLIRPAQVIVAK